MHTVGVIGTGEIARLHIQAIRSLGWRIAGGCDTDPAAVKSFCKCCGGRVYPEVQQLLRDPEVDVIYLCTRHNSHPELCMAAMEAGKSVFMEKPAAMGMKQARELLACYRRHSVPVAVGYNMRVAPATLRFRVLLQEYGAQVKAFRASMTGPPFMDGWASDPVEGGGVLLCQGSHMFDLLSFTLGSPVAAICADAWHIGIDQAREPNAAMLLIRLKNGVCGTLLLHDRGNAHFHAGKEGRMVSLTAYAPEGTFEMDAYGGVRWGTSEGFFEEKPEPGASQCERWGYAAQACEFARLLETGKSSLCTLEQGVEVVQAVEAAKIAVKSMQWTPVKQARRESAGNASKEDAREAAGSSERSDGNGRRTGRLFREGEG